MIAMLLAMAAQALAPVPFDRPFPEQRAAMAAHIRAAVAAAAPKAVTPAFDRALGIVAALPREDFVQRAGRRYAYLDAPQLIGHGQTISDPYIVTLMTAALDLPPDATVLDVGTGSGYQAAVLAPLARSVVSIEIVVPLAHQARRRLRHMRYRNVEIRAGDGFAGAADRAPFDGIVVAAGAATIPQPLLDQLKTGGRVVMPIGPSTFQEQIIVATKAADGQVSRCSLGPAAFVPLTGRGERPAGLRGLSDRSLPLCYGAPVT